MEWSQLKPLVDEQLETHGLCFLGLAKPNQPEALAHYKKWLSEGRHAEMSYLETGVLPREDPSLVHPGSEFVLLVGFRYGAREKLFGEKPRVAQYARLKDYHRFMRKKLDAFVDWFSTTAELKGQQISCRPTVDSAPVLERAMAASAGAGFVGKNTCYIHHSYGSFLLLAEVFVSGLNLKKIENLNPSGGESDSAVKGCGSCRRCQVHCPTGALDEDYRIDARKCLAYWSIEHRGPVPVEFWKHFATFAFGCDICQNVCPKNRGVDERYGLPATSEYIKVGSTFELDKVLAMDQKGYVEMFGGTPLTRAKFVGLKRNAIIASVALASSPSVASAEAAVQRLQEKWKEAYGEQWAREDDSKETIAKTLKAIPEYLSQHRVDRLKIQ